MRLLPEEYESIVEFSPNMIWRSNVEAECDYFNQTWLEFTGKTLEEEIGDGWTKGVHPEDFDRCLNIYLGSFEKRIPFEMEYRLKRYDGEYRWINDRAVPIYKKGRFFGYIGSCVDVTEKIEGKQLAEMAKYDGLVNVYNRQYFEKVLHDIFLKAKNSDKNLIIIMFDIDKFKNVNDNYGHKAGDEALKVVTQTAKDSIRNTDLFGRFGGDEFIIALTDLNLDTVKEIAERIRSDLEKAIFTFNNHNIKITSSFGLVKLTNENKIEELIIKADKALYEAKERGGNNVITFKNVSNP